jgi:hypothetical protein
MFTDLNQSADYFGVPLAVPSNFPVNTILGMSGFHSRVVLEDVWEAFCVVCGLLVAHFLPTHSGALFLADLLVLCSTTSARSHQAVKT